MKSITQLLVGIIQPNQLSVLLQLKAVHFQIDRHPTFSKIEFDGGVPSPVKYNAVDGHHPAESTLDLRGLEGSPLPQQPNSARGPMPKPKMGDVEEVKYNALTKAHPSHSNLTFGGDYQPVQRAVSPRGGPQGVHVSQSNFQLGSGPDPT